MDAVLNINMNSSENLFWLNLLFIKVHLSNVCFQSALRRMIKTWFAPRLEIILSNLKLFHIRAHTYFLCREIMKCLKDLSNLKDYSKIVNPAFFRAKWFNMLFKAFTQIWLIQIHSFTCMTLNSNVINVVLP